MPMCHFPTSKAPWAIVFMYCGFGHINANGLKLFNSANFDIDRFLSLMMSLPDLKALTKGDSFELFLVATFCCFYLLFSTQQFKEAFFGFFHSNAFSFSACFAHFFSPSFLILLSLFSIFISFFLFYFLTFIY